MGKPLSVGLAFYRTPLMTGGDLRKVLDWAKLADAKGVDQVAVSDHIVFASDAPATYPHGPENFPSPLDEPWYEPLTVLAGIAGCTERVRLATNILIMPLRSGVEQAKILATLDQLSKGRVQICAGAGWQKQEFDACNMPFEGRFTHMEEQVEACRLLWTGGPVSYHGKFINFDDIWCYPKPVQKSIPILFGLPPTSERHADRIGRLADGWLPTIPTPEYVSAGMANIRKALAKHGRDDSDFEVNAALMPVFKSDGSVDLDATFAQAPAMIKAGATLLDVGTNIVIHREDQFEEVIDRLVALKG